MKNKELKKIYRKRVFECYSMMIIGIINLVLACIKAPLLSVEHTFLWLIWLFVGGIGLSMTGALGYMVFTNNYERVLFSENNK